jgi:hypothetical protein
MAGQRGLDLVSDLRGLSPKLLRYSVRNDSPVVIASVLNDVSRR